MLLQTPPPHERRTPARLLARVAAAALAVVATGGASARVAAAQTAIVAQRHAVAFASTAATPTPPTQDLLVTNRGPVGVPAAAIAFGVVQYPAGAPTGWLTTSRTMSGTLAVGATAKLGSLSVAPGTLPNGSYRASVAVNATNAGSSSVDSVIVTLDVEGPRIALSTSAVTVTPTTTSPDPRPKVTVSNAGSTQMTGVTRGPIEYLAGSTTNWLGVSGGPGPTMLPGGSADYTLYLSKLDLPAGTYTARFPISSTNSSNGPLWVDVTLNQAGPALAADGPSTFNIATASNASTITSPFWVRNVGTSAAQGFAAGPITYGGGASGWLSTSTGASGALAANGTRLLNLNTVSAHNLAPGTYTASVPVHISNGDNANPPTALVTLTVGNPVLHLPVTSVAAQSNATTPTPPNMNVGVQNTGTSTLRNVTRTVSYAAGEPTGWLSLFNDGWSTVNPGATSNFSLQFTPTSLPAGVYHARIAVSAALNAPQYVDVTLTRSAAEIAVPAVVAMTSEKVGDAAFPTKSTNVTVSNGGAGTLGNLALGTIGYAAGEPTGWLQATLSKTTAPATLTLKATSTGLAAGTYTATVPVTSPDAGNSPQIVTVGYTVLPATISVSSGTMYFTGVVGGANPAPATRPVSNAGSIALDELSVAVSYAAGAQTGWLQASLDATTAPATITLAPTTGALPVGQHAATVTVSSAQSGVASNPTSFAVRFTVADAPTIGFRLPTSSGYATGHAATVTAGAANPSPASYQVLNKTGGTLSGLSIDSVTYGAGQPTGWLSATLTAAAPPADLRLDANAAGLPAGTYVATAWVASPVATNSPAPFTYTLTVKSAPVLALAPATVQATAMAGTAPNDQAVTVSNATGGAMTGLAIGTIVYQEPAFAGWLATSSLSATSFPAGSLTWLNLRYTSAALPPGVYHATVPVTSPDATNGPQSVAVTLTVSRPPSIALAPSAVPLQALVGGATTAPASVAVTNAGDNTLNGLALGAIAYGAGGTGWLQATLSGISAPAHVTLRATPNGLAAGTYTAQVPVVSTATGVDNSPQAITVTFVVTQQPILVVSPTNPALAAVAGAAPVATSVAVMNAGGGLLDGLTVSSIDYTSAGSGWLAATLDVATAPATLTLSASAAALAKGTYTANVVVASPAASNGSVVVPVTFTVAAQPAIALAANAASFTSTRGASSPAAKTIAVTNGGDGILDQLSASVAAGGQAWLAATLDRSVAPAVLTLTPSTGALASGSYSTTVTIASAIGGVAPRTVTVSLTVAPQPEIAVASTTASFAATAGGANPAPQAIAVTNGGDGTLSGLSVSVAGAPAWLAVALDKTTAPAQLTLTPNVAGLAAGSYTAAVTVASTVAGATPKTIDVTLTVAPPALAVTLSAPHTLISLQVGAPASRYKTIAVGSATGDALSGLTVAPIVYGSGSGWLTPKLSGVSTPATLTLHGLARGLAAGVYSATVTVSAAGAAAAAASVTLEVVDLKKCELAMTNPTVLPASELQRLDALGNADGTYNLGDYQALRARLGLK